MPDSVRRMCPSDAAQVAAWKRELWDALDEYIDAGRLLVARSGDAIVGHAQVTDTDHPQAAEIASVAVEPAHRRRGIGRALVAAVSDLARHEGRSRLVVATVAADVANLHFYQRLGFRMRSIERDAFTAAAGYEPRDRVWLDLPLVRG